MALGWEWSTAERPIFPGAPTDLDLSLAGEVRKNLEEARREAFSAEVKKKDPGGRV